MIDRRRLTIRFASINSTPAKSGTSFEWELVLKRKTFASTSTTISCALTDPTMATATFQVVQSIFAVSRSVTEGRLKFSTEWKECGRTLSKGATCWNQGG